MLIGYYCNFVIFMLEYRIKNTMFNQISKDSYILNIYDKISFLEDNQTFYCNHSQSHINNVVNTVESILTGLGYDEGLIEDAKIAATLHDIGCVEGKDNHAERSYKMAKKYLKDNKIKLNNQKMVLDAIRYHSDSFDTDNIITLAIMFADKIDHTKSRLSKLGYTVSGVRQISFIDKINVSTLNSCLSVQFIVTDDFNREEFETFYFVPKIFKAISSFANKVNLKPLVLIGDSEWICPILP